jgi:hypothetical protein
LPLESRGGSRWLVRLVQLPVVRSDGISTQVETASQEQQRD